MAEVAGPGPSPSQSSSDDGGLAEELLEALAGSDSSDAEAGPGPSVGGGSRKRGRGEAGLEGAGGGGNGPEEEEEAEAGVCPPHPGTYGGMCIRCGQVVDGAPGAEGGMAEGEGVSMKYVHGALQLDKAYAENLRRRDLARVLGERKLILVLDLDHTLLNSASFQETSEEDFKLLDARWAKQAELPEEERLLCKLAPIHIWTKLRPGVHRFLRDASRLYEMYIYTMGDRPYADEMAKLLDRDGSLFHGRVISKRDSTERRTKDLDIVLGADSAVLIMDDSITVWPKHARNVLVMERYHYHPSSLKSFGATGKALLHLAGDEDPAAGPLARAYSVLEAVHAKFFAGPAGGDVRDIFGDLKLDVLDGVCILFTHVIPKNVKPSTHKLWRLAHELGARCVLDTGDRVTHVVAGSKGTDKARWGRDQGRHVVGVKWLYACGYLWQRAAEERYAIG